MILDCRGVEGRTGHEGSRVGGEKRRRVRTRNNARTPECHNVGKNIMGMGKGTCDKKKANFRESVARDYWGEKKKENGQKQSYWAVCWRRALRQGNSQTR